MDDLKLVKSEALIQSSGDENQSKNAGLFYSTGEMSSISLKGRMETEPYTNVNFLVDQVH